LYYREHYRLDDLSLFCFEYHLVTGNRGDTNGDSVFLAALEIVNAFTRNCRWKEIVAVILVAWCAGCGFTEGRKEAEQLAEQYFVKARADDLDGMMSLYSPRFFAVTSRDHWREILEEQRSRCGTPQSHALISWKVLSSVGSNAGVRTTLVYDVKYSSCQVAETLIIFKPSGGENQIQGHFFRQKENDPGKAKDSPDTFKA
jgi:hypothetical protein